MFNIQKAYCHKKIEPIVQMHWEKKKIFQAKKDSTRKKYYCLSMLPYPSGKLHIGHVRNYTIGDVISRYQRLLGKNVLQPIGWDAFGLPAERAAIKNNIPPDVWTYSNIFYMKNQLKSLGFAYDWSREIITCKPEYYRWEQWFFTILYQKGLIYKKTAWVNWCPQDQTTLANEQVINSCCWRCNTKIQHKKIPQWFIKITKYADQLLHGLNTLENWPQKVKSMQKNWIGRSEGIEIYFKIINHTNNITVYTTRSDIIMGVTYLAISIDHPLSVQASINNLSVSHYLKSCEIYNKRKTSKIFNTKITGIVTNMYAVHPLTNEILPIWISNIVSNQYGTGAIMGVPAHNQEDWKFAQKYNLPIKPVVLDKNNQKPNFNVQAMVYKGKLFNSGEFNDLNHQTAIKKINEKLIQLGAAKQKVCYRIQDWNISRQRYWGVPIPIITLKNGKMIPISAEQLPVILPKYVSTNNTINPLKDNNWIHTTYENSPALREIDTFDTFIESSWYYARYTCPNYKYGMLSPSSANYWLPIDQYIGGIEHATMHLIYFRFYHKLMKDFGLVNSDEPAKKLLCQGMVLSDAFYYINKNNERIWVSPLDVTIIKKSKTGHILESVDLYGNNLTHFGMVKMSKSKNNGIDPSVIIKKYGADTLRLFIMFAAPVSAPLEWKESGIIGSYRFLKRLWNLVYEHIQNGPPEKLEIASLNHNQQKLRKKVHETILKVTDDIDRRQMFNTAIASIMKLINNLIPIISHKDKQDRALLHEALSSIIRMLYPFIPHITFVLWKALGSHENIDDTEWPTGDQSALVNYTKTILVQINGKVQRKITVLDSIDYNSLLDLLLKENSSIFKYLKNKQIIKTVYIPNKLINLVIK